MMVVKLEEGFERVKAAAYAWSHTAAPMLSGTLVTIIGFTPVGFARSTAGEYAGNIFWIVGFALIVSWLVAVVFTPYLGVKLLPDIAPVAGGHAGIYSTPRYQRLRRLISWAVDHRFKVAGMVVAVFLLAGLGMGFVKHQFFPSSDRPEVLVEVQMPEGTSIEADHGRRHQSRTMGASTTRGQDRDHLHWPGRAPLLLFLQPRAAGSRLRETGHPDS